ncbi:hypothetical protein DICSQDRAFT_64803 [Dichomitus squalens LYAD-421 SS1]|nr:uncharacterized protein DICSQDRAFT_64803 [Dichomitus squalens LYAD-421 SS1]EJF59543.1 hypothetical protein DICSQDRAFT_64803 [Dichomitus squalens LYAD-421 SS1]TBU58573.1 hypothetical protein BD310DRAFT_819146 [Dichomitus squalens]
MVAVACILFFLSTMRWVVDVKLIYDGFIGSADPALFFQDTSKQTWKNAVYACQTFLGDGVLIYRAYIVWQSPWVIVIPVLSYLGMVVAAIHTVWSIAQPTVDSSNIFLRQTGQWVLSFYSTTLATNLLATSLIAYRLWTVNASVHGLRKSSGPMPILLIIVECGALYSCALISMIAAYTLHSNSAFLIIDITGPIIPITFYLIIIRVTMARIARTHVTSGSTSTGAHGQYPLRPWEVRIGRFTETYTTTDPYPSVSLPSQQDNKGTEPMTGEPAQV